MGLKFKLKKVIDFLNNKCYNLFVKEPQNVENKE